MRWIQREPESTDIEVMAGAGARLLIYTALVLQQLGGGLWLNKNYLPRTLRIALLHIQEIASSPPKQVHQEVRNY